MSPLTRNRLTSSTTPAAAEPLVELLPGVNLTQFFTENTGCAPDQACMRWTWRCMGTCEATET